MERLELVERFEDLRVGMLVVVKPDVPGWNPHRCMIIRRTISERDGEPAFVVLPKHIDTWRDVLLNKFFVDKRLVFRIVDDTEQAEQMATARPRVKVDAR